MAKKVKNNWFNRIFRHSDVQDAIENVAKAKKIISEAPDFIQAIGDVRVDKNNPGECIITGCTSLLGLLDVHRRVWKEGFQCEKLGPDRYGIFRTESISNMTADEVFLGNCYGLWIKPLSLWETTKDEGLTGGNFEIYRYCTVYQIILRQYKLCLISGIRNMEDEAQATLKEFTLLGY